MVLQSMMFNILCCTMGMESAPPCRHSISSTVGSFQSEQAFACWKALTIESSLVSGCGQGNERVQHSWKYPWVKFPVLAPSRGQNVYQKGWLLA